MKGLIKSTLLWSALLLPLMFGESAYAQWTRSGTNTYVTNTGDIVGIGTTTPTGGKTQISSSGTDPQLLLTQTDGTQWSRLRLDANGSAYTLSVGGASSTTPQIFNIYHPTSGNFFSATTTGNIGIGNNAPVSKLQVTNGSVLFDGTTGTTPASGNGTRLEWIPAKAAFRAGAVSGTFWDDANVGSYSIGLGYDAKASGANAVSIGDYTQATGSNSLALGGVTTASGNTATAMGGNTISSGAFATATGLYTNATGDISFTGGYNTTAQGYAMVAFGRYNVNPGTYNAVTWTAADPLFVLGNGTSTFATSNALTVLKNGNVGVGPSAPTHRLELNVDDAAKPSTNTWTIISDARLKTDIAPFTDGLNVIRQIKPITYHYNGKAGTPTADNCIGILAQDMQKIAPYTIRTFRAKLNPEDKTETELLGYNHHGIEWASINAIKELDAASTALQAENIQMKAQLADQSARIQQLEASLQQLANCC
ncbi:MAG: tail fiber domain-containing protein, partial [Candidatus Kapaibacterium sp.]